MGMGESLLEEVARELTFEEARGGRGAGHTSPGVQMGWEKWGRGP